MSDAGWPAWYADGLCTQTGVGAADEWFPDQGGDPTPARKVCARCPVRALCPRARARRHDPRGRVGWDDGAPTWPDAGCGMSGAYYTDESVTLYHGDFRDILPMLGQTFDAIVTYPPYGETSLDWDVWPDGWPTSVASFARSMWCFGSMRMFLDRRDEFAGWKFGQDVVWEKNTGTGFQSDRFKRVHEHATHWYRGDWGSIHHDAPTEATGNAKPGRVIRRGPTAHYGKQGEVGWIDEGVRIVRSVLKVRNMHGSAINETEKPTGILEPLIAYACPPGGVVLDVFAGSASTAVAARAIGRKAVLIEKRESQCEKAADRLRQGVLDLTGGAA